MKTPEAVTLQYLYNRVANWNSLRYDRVWNKKLTLDLLLEELNEYMDEYEKDPLVHRLDALLDVCYVALGAIWKLNKSEEAISDAFTAAFSFAEELPDYGITYYGYAFGALQTLRAQPDVDAADDAAWNMLACLATIFVMSFCEGLSEMRLTGEEFYFGLSIVCDSNDSKSVKKTDSDKKANDNDKGMLFIAPEPRLAQLLENRSLLRSVN